MKRLYILSMLLIISSLLVPMQARSISTTLEKTKLTQAQTNAVLQLIIYQKLNPSRYKQLLLEPNLQSNYSQIERLILSSSMRSQVWSFLREVAQVTGKRDRAYSHTKTRSLLAQSHKRLRERELDSYFTIQNSI
jgi:hypothetical protein